MIEVQEVRLDPDTRRTWRGDEEIVLSRKEFDLVHALMTRAGDIVSRDDLMRDVWTHFWTSSKTSTSPGGSAARDDSRSARVHLGWVHARSATTAGSRT